MVPLVIISVIGGLILNRLATNILSSWRHASIAQDDALILPQRANPRGWNFRERQVRRRHL